MEQIQVYQTKAKRLSGTRYHDVYDEAFSLYKSIQQKSKRRPYIRSAYFKKQKIFIDLFRKHLHEKNWQDRLRRTRFFPAAIELLKNSKISPKSKQNPNKHNEILHRFRGETFDGYIFYIQIREDKRTGNKNLFSIFPEQKNIK
jgi:hypothetical protein